MKRSSSLFSDRKKSSKIKVYYGSRKKAEQTIQNIRRLPIGTQRKLVNSMRNRARHNKNQTRGMREALRVFNRFLKTTMHRD